MKKRSQESKGLRASLCTPAPPPLSPTPRGSTHPCPWDHSGGPKAGSKKEQSVRGSTVGGKEGSGRGGDVPGTRHVFLQGPD